MGEEEKRGFIQIKNGFENTCLEGRLLRTSKTIVCMIAVAAV